MTPELSILLTGDGSTTILNPELDETYHSVHGATTEAEHVYINAGLAYFLQTNSTREANIFEVGFGTGLNACLSHQFALEHQVNVRYASIESFPLPVEIIEQLKFPALDKARLNKIHLAAWNSWVSLDGFFSLKKILGKIQQLPMKENSADVIYFDAFAPSKQPDMWVPEILEKMYFILSEKGVLVTYCARGQFQRDLRSLGFLVEALPGPPGKRQMVRAIKA
jgi:tRNA U34 5-methylaminomethyl-2-thiouridine-forming methyltransferase MnmC